MYRISLHAAKRIQQRNLRPEWLLAAMEGLQAKDEQGLLLLGDPVSRCTLVVNTDKQLIVTAVRLRPSKFKYIFERGRKNNGR